MPLCRHNVEKVLCAFCRFYSKVIRKSVSGFKSCSIRAIDSGDGLDLRSRLYALQQKQHLLEILSLMFISL